MAAGHPLPGTGTEYDRLRATVQQYFPVYETRLTPYSLVLLVHIDPATLESKFDELRQELWGQFFVPQLRREQGEYLVEVVRRPKRSAWGPYVNLGLLLITVVSTVSAGAFLWLSYRGGTSLHTADFLYGGLYFGLPLLTILGIHEFAHYVMARRHHVEASLPYFIPVPPPFLLFGTFGAFISLREPIPDKKALLDIGASGPIAGFIAAIPVTLAGLYLSGHAPVLSAANCGPTILGVNYGNMLIGLPAVWSLFQSLIGINPSNLHPLALAGWVGILVTAINLLPAGQLDGGHVARALLGAKSMYASWAALIILFGLGFLYPGWFFFAILVFFLGMRHPPPLNDITPLDTKRVGVGIVAVALLISGFVIIPIGTPTGQFALQNESSASAPRPPGFAMADNISLTIVNQDVVPRAFLFTATVTDVVQGSNHSATELTGAALTSFLANSTWAIHLPNGNTTYVNGSGNWSIPRAEFSTIRAMDGTATLQVQYANPQQAVVTLRITANQLCPPGVASSSESFTTQIS
ncbi:MAG: site-2 protease family protein [Thermoplasmata archaeon]|nr:site-2 protease family protein [Thermoplasmata archaeon]